jgi:hypothetical protein
VALQAIRPDAIGARGASGTFTCVSLRAHRATAVAQAHVELVAHRVRRRPGQRELRFDDTIGGQHPRRPRRILEVFARLEITGRHQSTESILEIETQQGSGCA